MTEQPLYNEFPQFLRRYFPYKVQKISEQLRLKKEYADTYWHPTYTRLYKDMFMKNPTAIIFCFS